MVDFETMQKDEPNEIVSSREPYFTATNLAKNFIFCGDDREVMGNLGPYIHVFGGILGNVYGLIIMEEVSRPGSVTDSFENETRKYVPVMLAAGVRGGVHSDTHAENGNTFQADRKDGAIGCGFAGLRQAISQHIAENRSAFIDRAQQLRPELLQTDADIKVASQVVDAHSRLAERTSFFAGSGRQVVLAAAELGAATMLVTGAHAGKDQQPKMIINLTPDSSLVSTAALRAGLPAYEQDSWASDAINDLVRSEFPYDRRQQQIAELIDTIGTASALGVDLADIAVRRP